MPEFESCLSFRSGMHGVNEELGRHRGREDKLKYALCGADCESVVHVLFCSLQLLVVVELVL